MATVIEFKVIGEPEPKGSARALMIKGRPTVVPDNSRSKKWEREVKVVASRVAPAEPFDCPVRLEVEFTMPRPQKPMFEMPATCPDVDKLVRSTADALTGILYVDDGRIVELIGSKRYGHPLGARIKLTTLDADQTELFDGGDPCPR